MLATVGGRRSLAERQEKVDIIEEDLVGVTVESPMETAEMKMLVKTEITTDVEVMKISLW